MEHYFAYGSNMLESRLRERCPTAVFESIARLANHELEFPRLSTKLGCGVAAVRPSLDSEVIGVLYSLSDEELPALDRAEGVAAGAYHREMLDVSLADGESVRAHVYLCPETGVSHRPSRAYLNFLIEGAEEHCFPADYVTRLREIPVVDEWEPG